MHYVWFVKIYEAKLQAKKGLKKVSLVLNPAVELSLQKFALETPKYFTNEEKQIIYSVAMRPDKMIYRKDINGEPANVFFTAETIEQCQQSYFKNNGNQSTNLNHSLENIEGVYPFESWIVADDQIDKAHFMKLDAKKGDWVMGFKIDNKDVWDNFIKTGEVDGLSVEAFLDYEIKNTNMNAEDKKTFIQELTDVFKSMFMAVPPAKTPEELAAEAAAAGAPDPMKELQDKYDLVMAENADLKEKLSVLQAKGVEDSAVLETMKADKIKAETDLATFKADNIGVKNLPNEKVKPYSEMTPLEKFRANK